jgi:hypothetical protein
MLFFGEWMFPVITKTRFLSAGVTHFLKQMFPGATGHYGCRYQHIFIPLIILALIGGSWTIVNKVRQKTIRLVLVIGLFAYLTYSQGVVYQMQKQNYRAGTSLTRWLPIELASWIKQNTPPDTTIALHDIGAMGYFSERILIDLVGLTNPEVLDCYWDGKNHRPYALEERDVMEYLKRKKPHYLIVVSDWDRYFNFSKHRDEHILKLIHESYPIPYYNTKYLVYQCMWQK